VKIVGKDLERRASDLRLRSAFSVCQSDMRLCPRRIVRRVVKVHDSFDLTLLVVDPEGARMQAKARLKLVTPIGPSSRSTAPAE
jgi:hypothetical protein